MDMLVEAEKVYIFELMEKANSADRYHNLNIVEVWVAVQRLCQTYSRKEQLGDADPRDQWKDADPRDQRKDAVSRIPAEGCSAKDISGRMQCQGYFG